MIFYFVAIFSPTRTNNNIFLLLQGNEMIDDVLRQNNNIAASISWTNWKNKVFVNSTKFL